MEEKSLDKFIDDLSDRFSQIPNFHLLHEDAQGQQLFNFIAKRFTELYTFKNLITEYYLPAATKSMEDALEALKGSKYQHLIKMTQDDLEDNYLISETETSNDSLEKYVKEQFSYRIIDWKNYPTVVRINWICNCVKHKDGLPIKEPVPKIYRHLPKTKKIVLTQDDFTQDVNKLTEQSTSIM